MVLDEDIGIILQSADGHGESNLNGDSETFRDDNDEKYKCNNSSLGKLHE